MKREKIYISIPITGKERTARERADLVKAALSRKGYEPVSPFDIYAGKDPAYEDHICCDLRAMLDCDAAFFCLGWEKSPGCRIEHFVACVFNSSGRKYIDLFYEDAPQSLNILN